MVRQSAPSGASNHVVFIRGRHIVADLAGGSSLKVDAMQSDRWREREPGGSERGQRGEKNDDEQGEQPAEDATQQPELTPPQDEQPVPARAAGWRQPRCLVTESMCSHMNLAAFRDTWTPLSHWSSATLAEASQWDYLV
jgi:hypothetical protein